MEKVRHLSKATRSNLITYGLVTAAFIIMDLLIETGSASYSLMGLLVPICAYICLATSLNLVVGVSGELSLGHAGFMSIGAFTGIVVVQLLGSGTNDVVRMLIGLASAAATASVAGILIGWPVMRLQGDYLAIVTLAFGEIIKNLLNNFWLGVDKYGLHFSMKSAMALGLTDGGRVLINGPQGASGIPHLSSFFAGYLLIMFTLFVVLNLINSRSGRAIMAVRDNRIAAQSVGINVTKYRLMAFVIAAALAGMAGALYAMNYSSVMPKKFDFNTSILILVLVVLGGMGNIRGGVISAAVLTILPERLRFIGDFRMLIYALVLIGAMNLTYDTRLVEWRRKIREKFSAKRQGQDERGGVSGE